MLAGRQIEPCRRVPQSQSGRNVSAVHNEMRAVQPDDCLLGSVWRREHCHADDLGL